MSGSLKARILRSAESLISKKGWYGVSTREIATAANVNESTLFRIFGGKQELASEIIEERIVGVVNATRESNLTAHLSASNICEAAMMAAKNYLQRVTPMVARLFVIFSITFPDLMAEKTALLGGSMLAPFIAQAQEAGQVIDGDPFSISLALRAALFGIVVMHALNHPALKGRDLQAEAEVLTKIWCRGVSRCERESASECMLQRKTFH